MILSRNWLNEFVDLKDITDKEFNDEMTLSGSKVETIANHLGTAREVVTRMLRYFQSEGMVKLARGTVEITDGVALEELQHA